MSQHEVSTRETGNGNGRLRSRNGGCELLFGDGTVEHTLDSWPCVPDGQRVVVSVSHEIADEISCVWPRPACVVSSVKGAKLMCGYLSNLPFSALWSKNGDIQVCDRAVEVEDKIHARVLTLTVDNTGDGRYSLFNEYLGPTV